MNDDPIRSEPCPDEMVKVVAAAMLNGVRFYRRADVGGFTYTIRYRDRGWHVPGGPYKRFGVPGVSSLSWMDIGGVGPTFDQWLDLFRMMAANKNAGWLWDGQGASYSPGLVEWVLPEEPPCA